MPVYEYYCDSCDGIYETLRPIREAADAVPCPECDRDGRRIMPTSFAAFTFRDGYPRRLPDNGTYWHLGKQVKKRLSGRVRPFEHPELTKPKPKPQLSKGDREVRQERTRLRNKEARKMIDSGVRPDKTRLPRSLR